MQNKIIKIGLLGLGNMGKSHLRNLSILKQVEICFIYDTDINLCKELSAKYNVKISTKLEDDLQNIDGVIIVTPSFTHFEYIKQVSKYVKNIFIEKPLTNTLQSTQDVVLLAKEKNLNIQVGFIERYNSALISLNKIIKNSKNIINIDFSRTNKISSRITDVDVIIDLMIHDIDLALYLNGKVKNIYAHGYIKNNVIEYARAIITHENGSFSNIVSSRITEKRIRKIQVTCDNMYIECDLFNKSLLVSKQTDKQYIKDVLISSQEETIDVRYEEGLLLELIDFIDLCNGKNINIADENDGLYAMEVASEIQKLIMGAR